MTAGALFPLRQAMTEPHDDVDAITARLDAALMHLPSSKPKRARPRRVAAGGDEGTWISIARRSSCGAVLPLPGGIAIISCFRARLRGVLVAVLAVVASATPASVEVTSPSSTAGTTGGGGDAAADNEDATGHPPPGDAGSDCSAWRMGGMRIDCAEGAIGVRRLRESSWRTSSWFSLR